MKKVLRVQPYLYVLPLVALLAFVFGYPLVRIFEFSFKMVRGIDGPWIGLRNYELILSQGLFWESVLHNLQLLLAIPVMIAISLLVSILLYERLRGWKLYRIIVFIPFILAVPIIAVVMKRMFQFNGPVNEVLRWLSLDFMALDWIGSSNVALWTVMILIIWRESALGIILFLARLMSLDESILEAARLDGATWRQRVWHIIIPQMRGVIEFFAVVSVITMLAAVFAYIFIMGGGRGGPGTATMVIELYIFNALIRTSLPGIAAAASVLLFLVSVLLIFPLFSARRRARAEEAGTTTVISPVNVIKQCVLMVSAFLALVPTLFMIMTALKSNEEYAIDKLGFPRAPVLDHFRDVLIDSPFIGWMTNSLVLVIGAVLLSAVISCLAAYAIASMEFRGRDWLLASSTALMAVPPVVMIVPLFVFYTQLGLISTYPGAIIIYAGLITPFSVYLLTTFFRTIPKELFEAARMDGANSLQILWTVVLPVSLPAFVTLIIVNSLYVWNDLLIAIIFLQDDAKRTLMAGISVFQGRYNNQVPLTMAGMVIASAPMFILYIIFQKHFIRGLMSGAVK